MFCHKVVGVATVSSGVSHGGPWAVLWTDFPALWSILWNFLFKLVFKNVPKPIWQGCVTLPNSIFQLWLAGLARSFPLQVCLQTCTKLIWRAWASYKLHFRGVAHVLSASHFVFEAVFKRVPKLIWRAWVPSQINLLGLARVLGASYFLFKFISNRVPKLIWRPFCLFQTPFVRFGSRAWL